MFNANCSRERSEFDEASLGGGGLARRECFQLMLYHEGAIVMKNQSTHSQDYDRKHGTDHDVKDKAALEEKFIDKMRKGDERNEANQGITSPEHEK